MITRFLSFIGLFCMVSCQTARELDTIKELNLTKYAGKWNEIARLPNWFEKGLECVSANYILRNDGKIEVLNQGRIAKKPSEIKKAKGVAWMPDPSHPGRLKVSFFRPFSGKYWIIALDNDYQHSLVGDPSRKYLWILSRSKTIEPAIYEELLRIAKRNGFPTEKLILTKQDCP
jgi:apolipoprotein D and lipocalin family protein